MTDTQQWYINLAIEIYISSTETVRSLSKNHWGITGLSNI